MEGIGWLSTLPPLVAIYLAIRTRQVIVSLGIYIWLGWTLLAGGNPFLGLVDSLNTFLAAVGQPNNLKTLVFSGLIGSLIVFTQRSGGMEGFIDWVDERNAVTSKRSVRILTLLISMAIFTESNFGLLVSGSVSRPLFDRAKVAREKLAYIIDSTCAPKCILIPLNAWGAYLIGLLAAQQVARPTALLLSTLVLNFYAILSLGLALVVAVFDWNIGPMGKAEERVRMSGQVLPKGGAPLISEEVSGVSKKEGIPSRALNMVGPILCMICVVPWVLWETGEGDLMGGDGAAAILWGVIAALVLAAIMYRIQGILTVTELIDDLVLGIKGLMPVLIILALAFTISTTTTALGTGIFIAQAIYSWMPVQLMPALIFLLSCLVAFSTGTSWGTFAIMIPIVLPMSEMLGLDPSLTLAAALGGGIFGDHCSPISDSTIVASMAAATDHISHVRTQIPYALLAASGALFLFLLCGILF
jgi:tetracycline resistance efflux pump